MRWLVLLFGRAQMAWDTWWMHSETGGKLGVPERSNDTSVGLCQPHGEVLSRRKTIPSFVWHDGRRMVASFASLPVFRPVEHVVMLVENVVVESSA